jgi:hypothetical protein
VPHCLRIESVGAIMPQGLQGSKALAAPARDAFSAKRNSAGRPNICYADRMAKTMQSDAKAKKKKKAFVIGSDNFAKISAVEGIRLTPAMKKRASEAERQGLSAEEYRETIIRAYRKA